MTVNHLIPHFLMLEARIGFDPVAYSGNEDGGSVSFMFGVLEGNIAFSVNVLFSTSSGTAISELIIAVKSPSHSCRSKARLWYCSWSLFSLSLNLLRY